MKQIKKIVLIGMRGSGKSHFGSCLADELRWPKIDMDEEIENITYKTIPSIINTQGWDSFRDLEHKVAKKISCLEKVVISTGGGAITFPRNQELLKKDSLVVFLFASQKELVERLENDDTRPPLKDGKTVTEEIADVWKERGKIYFSQADLVFRAKEGLSKNSRENVELNAKILAKKIRSLL